MRFQTPWGSLIHSWRGVLLLNLLQPRPPRAGHRGDLGIALIYTVDYNNARHPYIHSQECQTLMHARNFRGSRSCKADLTSKHLPVQDTAVTTGYAPSSVLDWEPENITLALVRGESTRAHSYYSIQVRRYCNSSFSMPHPGCSFLAVQIFKRGFGGFFSLFHSVLCTSRPPHSAGARSDRCVLRSIPARPCA